MSMKLRDGIVGTAMLAVMAVGSAIPAAAQSAYGGNAYTPFRWTGFYVGVNVGYGWSADRDSDLKLSSVGIADPSLGLVGANALSTAINTIPNTLNTRSDGIVGGAQIGYNVQVNKIVWGVEADFSGANLSGSASRTGSAFSPPDTNSLPFSITADAQKKLDYLGTFRGRVGYTPVPTLLLYATGGLAYGHVTSSTTVADIPQGIATTPASGSASQGLTGWTVGGGFETAIASNWTLKAEYLYYDLGHLSYALSPSMATDTSKTTSYGIINTTVNADMKGNIVRLGLNYKTN
jgi:outer membrane immunogenic protein